MEKKKFYLSLPISGRDMGQVKSYANYVKDKWTAKGFDVITPFDVVPDEDKPYNYCMGKDIEALLDCEGIILCHDWFSSKGCRAECSVAQVYGKQIKIDNTVYEEVQV